VWVLLLSHSGQSQKLIHHGGHRVHRGKANALLATPQARIIIFIASVCELCALCDLCDLCGELLLIFDFIFTELPYD
jgi:hypothetical protein